MAAQGALPRPGFGFGVPEYDRRVVACRGDPAAVRAHGDGDHIARIAPPWGAYFGAGLNVPDGNGWPVDRDQVFAVRCEGHGVTKTAEMVPELEPEFVQLLGLVRVPAPEFGRPATRGEILAVGAK